MRREKKPKETKSAATLSVIAPGAMTLRGRKAIAAWLVKQARMLVKDGEKYSDTGRFVARYWWVAK